MSTGTYRVTDAKCATCSYWTGARRIEFRNNQPYYVEADARPAPCMANNNAPKTPGERCLRFTRWEKLG